MIDVVYIEALSRRPPGGRHGGVGSSEPKGVLSSQDVRVVMGMVIQLFGVLGIMVPRGARMPVSEARPDELQDEAAGS